MVNKYYQKNKEKLQKEARERYQNLPGEEKKKGEKRLETDINIFLMKKKTKCISIIVVELRIFLKKKNKKRLNI